MRGQLSTSLWCSDPRDQTSRGDRRDKSEKPQDSEGPEWSWAWQAQTNTDFINYHVLHGQRQVMETKVNHYEVGDESLHANIHLKYLRNIFKITPSCGRTLTCLKPHVFRAKHLSCLHPNQYLVLGSFPIPLTLPSGQHMAIDNFCLGSWHSSHSCSAMLLSLQLWPLAGT